MKSGIPTEVENPLFFSFSSFMPRARCHRICSISGKFLLLKDLSTFPDLLGGSWLPTEDNCRVHSGKHLEVWQLLFLSLIAEPQNHSLFSQFFYVISFLPGQEPQGWPLWIGPETQCTPYIIHVSPPPNFCFSSTVCGLSWQLLP